MEGTNFLEGVARCNGVDKQETLASAHVLLTHSPVMRYSAQVSDMRKERMLMENVTDGHSYSTKKKK